MTYSPADIERLRDGFDNHQEQLGERIERIIERMQTLRSEPAKRYLGQGVCRRLKTIRRAVEHVFEIFPPDRVHLLDDDERLDLAIYVQACSVNTSGIMDNLAWAIVNEAGGLVATVGDQRNVGLHRRELKPYLSIALSDFLSNERIVHWHKVHAKEFRDATAHRLPLYIPPFEIYAADWPRFEEGRSAVLAARTPAEVRESAEILASINSLKRLSFRYSGEVTEKGSMAAPYLHAQLLADGFTTIALIDAYLT